uniref:Uncharacterized protein n=1 Tax=viral metagenome TaxID=1070528 RepID=A0A6H2A1F3_9ZZZZ
MIKYKCPECEDEGELPDDTKVVYCGICAGDNGKDVPIIKISQPAASAEPSA